MKKNLLRLKIPLKSDPLRFFCGKKIHHGKIWCVLNSNNKLPNKYLSQYLTNVLGKQTHFLQWIYLLGYYFTSYSATSSLFVFASFFLMRNDFSRFYYPDEFSCLFFAFFLWGNFHCVFFFFRFKRKTQKWHIHRRHASVFVYFVPT